MKTSASELNLEPRLGREQAGLFYQAVTRADNFLLLTRPTLAGDGERWEGFPLLGSCHGALHRQTRADKAR